jgi:hypothetical protein
MFNHIRKGLDHANIELGKARGEAPDARSIIEIENENGETLEIDSSNFVLIERNKKTLKIRAFEIEENDIVIELEI